ncbi:NAD(P)-binding domain-containing protein [Pseudomonas putida]|uniref:NAD(P)-binding domain-containing protein n=1 Tax=Pseudomonas putida TaxID=303 RepID=UPI00383B9158
MSTIAVLGLGAMGTRMARQLIGAGHSLVVWNRTPDAAQALVALGATQAHTSVWAPVAHYLSASMLAGEFAAQLPVALIEKDFAYTLAQAPSPGQAPTLAAAQQVFQRAIAQGLEGENMTSVVKLFTNQPA